MTSKQLSKAQRIRNLLADGKTPAQIAAALGTTLSYVYVVKSTAKKKTVKRGRGRPKGSKNKPKIAPTNPALNAYQPPADPQPVAVPLALIPAAPLGFKARLRVLFTGRV